MPLSVQSHKYPWLFRNRKHFLLSLPGFSLPLFFRISNTVCITAPLRLYSTVPLTCFDHTITFSLLVRCSCSSQFSSWIVRYPCATQKSGPVKYHYHMIPGDKKKIRAATACSFREKPDLIFFTVQASDYRRMLYTFLPLKPLRLTRWLKQLPLLK